MGEHDREATLESEIRARGNLPRHVAVIMDGNGRWAESRGLPRIAGHHAAVEAVRDTVAAAGAIGIDVLTLYTFSIENWNRPKDEVDALMALLKSTLDTEALDLGQNNVRLETIGRVTDLPLDVQETIATAKRRLARSTGLTLVLALSYGGRAEISDAVRGLISEVRAGTNGADLDESAIERHLYTQPFPDPDLLIRTSGEMRISNFLLWQLAYSELWFTDVLWPDFRRIDLYRGIRDYQERERRFGRVRPVAPARTGP
ncbi:MAG: isoprenyl transferase [bacterium]